MKTFFYSISLLLLFCTLAQENNPFTTGFEETISSKIVGQERKVWIHIPDSNGGNKSKTEDVISFRCVFICYIVVDESFFVLKLSS